MHAIILIETGVARSLLPLYNNYVDPKRSCALVTALGTFTANSFRGSYFLRTLSVLVRRIRANGTIGFDCIVIYHVAMYSRS